VNARKWQPKGKKGTIQVKTNTGRKRINILGALNFSDFSTVVTLTEEKCNAIRIVEFFQKIKEKYPDKTVVIVIDNAKYNQAWYTRTFAEWYDIELFFLPPYAPNLNLIERLWKFTKKKLVHNRYYEEFETFVNEVEKYFTNLSEYSADLNTLLSRKFQIINMV